MSATTAPDIGQFLDLVGGAWEHSALFRFLREHHDAILERQNGERMNWRALCAYFGQCGLTNVKGEAPSISCARKTWYRVRRSFSLLRARLDAEAAEREAVREQARIDALARKQAQAAEKADIRQKMAQAEQEFQARQLAQARRNSPSVLYPQGYETPAPLTQTFAPAVASVAAAPVVPQDNTTDDDQPRVRIGEVAHFVQMKTQAPRYGHERDIPLPPPYVGPRPAGMPEDLPLEALMPLDASGRDENGNYDFLQMPGLPRRSFYDNKRIWALDCLPMIEAIPPRERPPALKSMRVWLTMVLGQ